MSTTTILSLIGCAIAGVATLVYAIWSKSEENRRLREQNLMMCERNYMNNQHPVREPRHWEFDDVSGEWVLVRDAYDYNGPSYPENRRQYRSYEYSRRDDYSYRQPTYDDYYRQSNIRMHNNIPPYTGGYHDRFHNEPTPRNVPYGWGEPNPYFQQYMSVPRYNSSSCAYDPKHVAYGWADDGIGRVCSFPGTPVANEVL